jgi:hypothetical protein
MTPLVLFGFLVLVPIAIAVILRVNAAILFMSLCVGEVLVQFMAGDANSLVSTLSSTHGDQIATSTIKLILLLIPPALTALFMFHNVHGGAKAILNILPAIGVGLLTALLVKPLLSTTFQHTLERSSLWHQLSQAQTLVVGISALLCLLFLWLQRHGSLEHGHGIKRHS